MTFAAALCHIFNFLPPIFLPTCSRVSATNYRKARSRHSARPSHYRPEQERVVARRVYLSVEVLRDLSAIVPEWWGLFSRSPDATPFQSPAWLLPWWECFGRGKPLVVAVREHGRMVGLGA